MTPNGRAARLVVSTAIAVVTAACHPVEHRAHVHFVGPETGFMQVNARLDCPEQSGDLTRTGASSDGASCTYNGPGDETVSLQSTPLAGAAPQAVLTRVEAELKSDTGLGNLAPPPPPNGPPPAGAQGKAWDAGPTPHDNDNDDKDDDDSYAATSKMARANDGHTHIDLPGVHIAAQGDKADVQLPGISIHANGDNAQVQAGWFGRQATIVGRDGGATIRIGRDDRTGVDCMFLITSERPSPAGYRAVGYLAKGPPGGPLVVAVFKAKSGRHTGHDLAGDGLKKLVRLNVHQGVGWFSEPQDGAAKGSPS